MRTCKETCCKISSKHRKSFMSSSIDQTVLQCGHHEDRGEEQYCTTLDDAEPENLGGSCGENTLLRDNTLSKVKGWIRGSTKIGPPLEVAVTHHQRRCGVEIMIESLSGDGTCSWVMIVNGMNKYVTEMTEETRDDHIDCTGESRGKFVAIARPKQTSTPTTSSTTSLPCDHRAWSDAQPGPFDKSCFEVSKKMIRVLRHDPSVPREEDGAVEFRTLAPMFRSEFASSQCWSILTWLNYLQRGGRS